jgi:hypothetical protein
MKKPLFFFSFYLALVSMILSSCNLQVATSGKLPGIDIDSSRVNTYFVIFEDPIGGSANSHRNGEFLDITAKNLTDQTIIFLPGYIHIFSQEGGSWIPVVNAMAYPVSNQVLPPTEIFPPGMVDTVIPSIPGLKAPTTIRIYFVGQVQGTDEKVGAYMDLTLLP